MLEKHVMYPFSSKKYMFSVNFIFFMNITLVFAIITCLGFLVVYDIELLQINKIV